ncbi:hypothetical protein [Massilia sp. CCM 8734]|uniref:hypothetical protein n=1 Tax=Massilia sp. CCM 8734 TaxID=2609283 RepID=UPI00141D9237|nr:hypothetical protein [Massilia sp. CCM 8734]NHZ99745.1 hypothetical protein [Massilia sp. CCM 8734]
MATLIFEFDFDERAEFEAESRGYLSHVKVRTDNDVVYPVLFYDPVRLVQDLDEACKSGTCFVAESGLILLRNITLRDMQAAVDRLEAEGYFDRLARCASDHIIDPANSKKTAVLTASKNAQDQDARCRDAWQRLADNCDDEMENTFCYQLFELKRFDRKLFLSLCEDMDLVLEKRAAPKENYKLLVWIISCIFRSVFSHFDKSDSYTITNFDAGMSQQWGSEYVEELRVLLEKTIDVAIE